MAAPKSEEVEVEDPMDEALKELYYNAEDPGSYGGVEKVTRGPVKQFLEDQQSYSLDKPA